MIATLAVLGAALTATSVHAGATLGVEWGGDFMYVDAWKGSKHPQNMTGG
jgi:hypothetical protein